MYYPVHSHILLEVRDGDRVPYSILCMNQKVVTIEEYVELRRRTANLEINEYLTSLLRTGLRYVIFASPIILINHEDEGIFIRNIFIRIERLMQSGLLVPHSISIADNQTQVPELLTHIFPQENGVFVGRLLYDNTSVYIPVPSLPTHLGIIGTTGAGKSNFMQVMLHGIIEHNLEIISGNLTESSLVASLAIDPHDEYALGPEGRGLYHIFNLLEPVVRDNLFGSFFYLYPHNSRIQDRLNVVSNPVIINYEEIVPYDLLNVQDFTSQQAEVMLAEHNVAHDNWINNILSPDPDRMQSTGHHPASVTATRRRLRALQRSNIFQLSDEFTSTLPIIIDVLESGKILDFNCSLLSDFEMFLFNTVIARTIFDIRKSLKASRTIDDFRAQLRDRLPQSFINRYQDLSKYISTGNEVRDPNQMPIVMFTIEEAPSILRPELMKGRNIFKDIARQGRKFNISLSVISQQITTLENAIISNINTNINLPVGSDKERRGLIDNASSTMQLGDLRSLEGTRGVAVINGNWLTKFQKLDIPRYITYFGEREEHFRNFRSQGTRTSLV